MGYGEPEIPEDLTRRAAQRFYERRGMAPAIVKLLRAGQRPAS